jgi:pimeloyl-ACP methyl ester carboxylesterase
MLARFDRTAFDPPPGRSRIRLVVTGDDSDEQWDVLISSEGQRVSLVRADSSRRPGATLAADRDTWREIAENVSAGLEAYRSGRLKVRHNLHLAVGLLAATAVRRPGRLEVRLTGPGGKRLSSLQAGHGEPVLMLHGLGATKASFLPTINALASTYRVIALDLPGFGDAEKPFAAAYDAAFFARFVAQALDWLDLERAHVIGHSMGGRVALELSLERPERVQSLTLLTPSLAWRRPRQWAPYLRLVRPELGLLQPAPRAIVDPLVRRMVPGAQSGWSAVGVDEFLRGFLNPRGRAAFYAAARNIYLEEPIGPKGLWDRLGGVKAPALFVWGTRDRLVPAAFARHVERAVRHAQHVELDCAHVPQFERPHELHAAVSRFLSSHPMAAGGDGLLARSR